MKDKRYLKTRQRGHPTLAVNITKVVKKKKNKNKKNLSYIECYSDKSKIYYANKCLKKSKN